MMKKLGMLTSVFLISIILMGCGNNGKEKVITENNSVTDNEVQDDNTTNQQTTEDNAVEDTNQSNVEVAEDAEKRIMELEEVDRATVLVTNETAYVAAVLVDQTSQDLSEQIEDKIVGLTKTSNEAIQQVYVSLNPDFVQQMTDYRAKINEGEPVEGFFEEFNDAMSRMFPDGH